MVLQLGHFGNWIRNAWKMFEICCLRRMEKQVRPIVWEKEDLLHGIQEKRNILHTVTRRKTNWTAHILGRKHVIVGKMERKIEGMGRRGRRRKQPLDVF